jgi:hypothetical protein
MLACRKMVLAGPRHEEAMDPPALAATGALAFPYLPREQHAKLTASAGVTDVTGCF